MFVKSSILNGIGGAQHNKELIFCLKSFADLCLKVKTHQYWEDLTDLLLHYSKSAVSVLVIKYITSKQEVEQARLWIDILQNYLKGNFSNEIKKLAVSCIGDIV